jgi:hypothetical protein
LPKACGHRRLLRRSGAGAEVFEHSLLPNGLRDHDDAALNEPAQDDLRDAFAVLCADRAEHLVFEDVVLAFGERRAHASIWTPFSRRNAWVSIC